MDLYFELSFPTTDQTVVTRPSVCGRKSFVKVSPIRPFTISAYDWVNIVIEALTLLVGQQWYFTIQKVKCHSIPISISLKQTELVSNEDTSKILKTGSVKNPIRIWQFQIIWWSVDSVIPNTLAKILSFVLAWNRSFTVRDSKPIHVQMKTI